MRESCDAATARWACSAAWAAGQEARAVGLRTLIVLLVAASEQQVSSVVLPAPNSSTQLATTSTQTRTMRQQRGAITPRRG